MPLKKVSKLQIYFLSNEVIPKCSESYGSLWSWRIISETLLQKNVETSGLLIIYQSALCKMNEICGGEMLVFPALSHTHARTHSRTRTHSRYQVNFLLSVNKIPQHKIIRCLQGSASCGLPYIYRHFVFFVPIKNSTRGETRPKTKVHIFPCPECVYGSTSRRFASVL